MPKLKARPRPAPTQAPLTILKRQTIPAVNLAAGSNFELKIMPEANSQALDLTATQAMTATEQILFETTFEGRKAIGGFILAGV